MADARARAARAGFARLLSQLRPGQSASVLRRDPAGRARGAARTGCASRCASFAGEPPLDVAASGDRLALVALAAVRGDGGLAAPSRRPAGGGHAARMFVVVPYLPAAALDARAPRAQLRSARGSLALGAAAARAWSRTAASCASRSPTPTRSAPSCGARAARPAAERRGGRRAAVAAVQPDARGQRARAARCRDRRRARRAGRARARARGGGCGCGQRSRSRASTSRGLASTRARSRGAPSR